MSNVARKIFSNDVLPVNYLYMNFWIPDFYQLIIKPDINHPEY